MFRLAKRFSGGLLVLSVLLLLPSAADAQAVITVVNDASGAVLPGATVQAASPVLIEKARSVISGGFSPAADRGSVAGHLQAAHHHHFKPRPATSTVVTGELCLAI